MAVNVGVAVLHPTAAGRFHLLRQAQFGELFGLTQLTSAGILQLLHALQPQDLPVAGPHQHPDGHTLPHRFAIHQQIVVPIHSGRPATPVPGADGQVLPPVQGPLQTVPHPGEHPKGSVALHDHFPGKSAVFCGLSGRLLKVAQQRPGLTVSLSIHIPGVDG